MNRDGARKSLWQEAIKEMDSSWLNTRYDVAIVGAGITGLTCAIRLQEAGKKCIILEAQNIGFGTTGGTTAHINTFFDARYDEVINNFGLAQAQLLAQGGKEALQDIKTNIKRYLINCDFEEQTAYLMALNAAQLQILHKIMTASVKAGINIQFANNCPFPVPHLQAAMIPSQAQFHPIQYINGLANAFVEKGGRICLKCRVYNTQHRGKDIFIETERGQVQAAHLIYATHTPPGVNILHFRNAPYRSYVLAAKLNGRYPAGLGYDLEEPYHYYRTQKIGEELFLIAGGEDHKTGHAEDTGACFTTLENYVRKYFNVHHVAYMWSSQYYEPADGLPYIGHLPGSEENIWVATGYNGNGMTFGTLAGRILSDLIVTGQSRYQQLFNPARIKPLAAFTNFVKEAADVVGNFVKDKLFTEKLKTLADLQDGEAKTVRYDGTLYAMYKDERGRLHGLNSTCPHTSCNVHWNSAEKTWDCPCHGSRFKINGEVINAPAVQNLKQVYLPED